MVSINSSLFVSCEFPMLRKLFLWTILIVVLGTTSCCFIGTQFNSLGIMDDIVPQLSPFGGTRLDMAWAFHRPLDDEGIGIVLGMDIPFSIVGDIVMLPITIPYTLLNREVDPRFQVEELEPTQQNEEPVKIDNDLRQELNKATEPWNKLTNDEQPELPPSPAE